MTSEVTARAAKYPKVTGSAFWRRKMITAFNKLDHNGDGYMTKEDFDEMGDQMVELNKVTGETADKVRGAFQSVWTNYYSSSSGPKTNLDIFLAKRLEDVNGHMRMHLDDLGRTMFEGLDANRDGHISIDEYLNFAEACRMGRSHGKVVFQIIDTNEDNEISVDEFLNALSDFMFSEDPSSPFKLFWGALEHD